MKKVLTAIATAFASFATAVAVYAADLPPEPAYKAAIVPPVPVYSWTGIYFGVNGGYGFGQQTPGSLFGDSFSAFNYSGNGWLGGVTAGAQLQSGHTGIGLEADIDWGKHYWLRHRSHVFQWTRDRNCDTVVDAFISQHGSERE